MGFVFVQRPQLVRIQLQPGLAFMRSQEGHRRQQLGIQGLPPRSQQRLLPLHETERCRWAHNHCMPMLLTPSASDQHALPAAEG